MDPSAMYDAMGEHPTVETILEAAESLPPEFREHLQTALVDYRPSDIVTRTSFVDVMTALMDRQAAAMAGPKVRHLTSLFEGLNDDGVIQFGAMEAIFGDNAGLVVGDKNATYTMAEFIELFGDLFDDDGNLMELPPLIIEQLRAIREKFNDMDHEAVREQMDRVRAEMALDKARKTSGADMDQILYEAAHVETERDSLYAELKEVKQKMRTMTTRPLTPSPPPPPPSPPPLPPPRRASPPPPSPAVVTYCDVTVDDDEFADDDIVDFFDAAAIESVDASRPLDTYAWYHKGMKRSGAERHLKDRDVGSFVVRDCSYDDAFTLSIKAAHKILHYIVREVLVDGRMRVGLECRLAGPEIVGGLYDDVPSLVAHHSTTPINDVTPLLHNQDVTTM